MRTFKLPETGPAVWRVDVGQSDPALAELWMQNNAGFVKHFVAGQRQHIALGTAQIWRKSIEIDNLKVTYTSRMGQEVIDIRPSAVVPEPIKPELPELPEPIKPKWIILKVRPFGGPTDMVVAFRMVFPRVGDYISIVSTDNTSAANGRYYSFDPTLPNDEDTVPRYGKASRIAHYQGVILRSWEDIDAWYNLMNVELDYASSVGGVCKIHAWIYSDFGGAGPLRLTLETNMGGQIVETAATGSEEGRLFSFGGGAQVAVIDRSVPAPTTPTTYLSTPDWYDITPVTHTIVIDLKTLGISLYDGAR